MDEQMTLMDMLGAESLTDTSAKLEVVKASFVNTEKTSWKELFEGFDELYAITFSSGLQFVDRVLDRFKYAEIIFGCEDVMNDDIAAIMAMQIESVQQLIKTKVAKHMAEKLAANTLKLYISRDTRSHEKIFILKSDDGRTRIITGSANMSASAFCGLQRENIVCFDDREAYEHYNQIFEAFRVQCADQLTHKAIVGTIADEEYLQDNIEEIPITERPPGPFPPMVPAQP